MKWGICIASSRNDKKVNTFCKKIIIILMCLIFVVSILLLLMYYGIVWPNSIFSNAYSVHGIDVSNHQGNIDWGQVAKNEKIKFAYIKATEGKTFKDKYFEQNWKGISQTGLYKGAYHYFTISSSGKEQAENFIGMVPFEKGCLPPVIDIEENGIGKVEFRKELVDYITLIEEKYHQKPILYVVYPLYDEYIKGGFNEYPIWIRDVIKPPKYTENIEWMFWQYCNRGRIKGVGNYVDLNVYNDNIDNLKLLLSK